MRLLSWAIGGCFALCLAAVLILATSFEAPNATIANAITAKRPMGGNSRQAGLPDLSGRRALATDRYEHLPLAFEPTGKKSAGDAKFLARGDGYALFLTPSETVLALGKHSNRSAELHLKMVGANVTPSFAALDELPGKSNYLLGNSPTSWRTNVPNYRKVAERGVYNGIDIIYYGNQRQLEYDFVVAPRANPGAIQIAFQGAKSLRIDSGGDLLLSVGGGDVRMHRPIAYQGSGDAKHEVTARYVVESAHSVSFQLGRYDAGQQLVIDPVLSYSTYLGGTNIDGANAIAVAPDNTAFIAGGTFSIDFPTAHPLQPNVGGPFDFPQDAFVAKISADGSTLLYSTYLGGGLEDVANGIAVDAAGDAYVTGTTHSFDFPVTFGSFNGECGGDGRCGASCNLNNLIVENAFVTKLNPAGSGIVYSGFLGEYENVRGQAIAVDQNEFAYVTGQVGPNITPTPTSTCSTSPPPPFPITAGASQLVFGGGTTDAFVTKISATGTTIEYSSYLGGADEDIGYGIAADHAGDAFVAGLTYSGNFPVTAGAAQIAYGGAGDAFVSEVNSMASGLASLVYSTYLGGNGLDQANGVALDLNGNVYVAGGTNSGSTNLNDPNNLFPSAAGFAKTNSGQGDAFVTKLNPAVPGTAGVIYFTYLGGLKADSAAGIAVDGISGNAYLTGSTVSSDFLGTAVPQFPPFQSTYGGGNADAFVTELNATGTSLIYSSYLGGTNTEIPGGIAVDSSGSAYVTGQTCSQDFPVSNPLQAAPGGNCDAYISKVSIQHGIAVNPAGLVFSAQSLGTTSASQTLTITNGDAPVTITSILKSGPQSGDFAVANAANCTTLLPPGGQCSIAVTFAPSAAGIRKAMITIAGKDLLNNPIPSPVVNLTGSTSTVTLSSSSLAFGTQAVGTTASQHVTVTNTGSVALSFSSITASGDFSETDTCKVVPLQPTTNCAIIVTYKPSVVGSSIGALSLTDNGTGSPQIVLLTGTGVQPTPIVALSASSLAFGTQPVGTTTSQQVTVTNTGSVALSFSSITASGDFSETNTCSVPLQPTTNCAINVTFKPSALGSIIGALTLTDNAPGSPQIVSLTGTGLQATPIVTLSASSLAFGTQPVGTTTSQQVTVTNTGSGALTISSITASGDFSETNTCNVPLQPTTNCAINVTFKPSAVGSSIGALTTTDNGTGSPQFVLLAGTGVQPTPIVALSTSSLAFGTQSVGTTTSQQVTVTNTGSGALTISSITASGDFSETNTCNVPLQPTTNCAIIVTFKPSALGSSNGALTITDNGTGSPQFVSLKGTGQGPDFTISTSQSSDTIRAGQSATYALTISALGGFSEPVTLSCSGLPRGAACLASSNPVTVGGTNPITVTITTAERSFVPIALRKFQFPGSVHGFGGALYASFIVFLGVVILARFQWHPARAAFGAAIVLLLLATACGSGSQSGVPAGTPAGTSQVIVTATSASRTHTVPLTLIVN